MKALKLILWATIFTVKSYATPIYYTFQGFIDSIPTQGDATRIIGDPIQYVLMFDQDKPGINVFHSRAYSMNDTPTEDYFLVKYISGIAEQDLRMSGQSHFFYGVTRTITGATQVQISTIADSHDEIVESETTWNSIYMSTPFAIDTWYEGQAGFIFREIALNYKGYSTMALTNISDENPTVPEPSSIWLIIFGLTSIILVAKRNGITPVS